MSKQGNNNKPATPHIDPELKEYAKNPHQRNVMETIEAHGFTGASRVLGTDLRNIHYLKKRVEGYARRRGYDPDNGYTRPVGEGQYLKGKSQLHDRDGNLLLEWTKSARDTDQEQAFNEWARGIAEGCRGVARPKKPPQSYESDLMAAYVIGDAHIGMLADEMETEAEDYNADKGVADLMGAVDYLLPCGPKTEYGLMVNVGDFIHVNDHTNSTPRNKNPLDVSHRKFRLMRLAGQVQRYIIDRMLKFHNQVIVVNAKGNHDPEPAEALSMFLEAAYEREPRVDVRATTSFFHYLRFGQNLIGINHGDKVKPQTLQAVMARDRKQDWGETRFHYWFLGDIHHKQAHELEDCKVETFNTLIPRDGWHAGQGYGAKREMQKVIIHQDYGIENRHICGIERLRETTA